MRIQGVDCGVDIIKMIACDFAIRGEQMKCCATGIHKFAIGNLQPLRVFEMDELVAFAQAALKPVEFNSGQRDMGGAVA